MQSINRNIIIASATAIFIGILVILIVTRKTRKKLTCKNSYLFIGDSTTADPKSFADQLRKKCPSSNIKKIAKSGAKTEWMVGAFVDSVPANAKYDMITILTGSNDIFSSLSIDSAKLNLKKLISLSLRHTDRLVLITPPNKKFVTRTTPTHKALIAEWEKFLKSFKGRVSGKKIYFVDLAELVDQRNLFSSDSQHINYAGHTKLLSEIVRKINIKTP